MIKKERAKLNRSIYLTGDDRKIYRENLLKLNKDIRAEEIKNKIINQDLFEALEYLPEKFVDLLFIDPPYNLSKNYNAKSFKAMNDAGYERWFDSWFSKLIKILKPDASIYICCDWKSSIAVYNVASKYLKVRNRISWEREKGRGAKLNWKNCSEDIWFFTSSDNYTFNIDAVKIIRKVLAPYKNENGEPKDWQKNGDELLRATHPSNIWTDITIPFWSMPENTEHPTQKPEKLLAKIILASSNERDFVFDPFLGSGTTAVTAKKLNRNFSGIEIDEEYSLLAEKRLDKAESDKTIQGFEEGIFWERNSSLKVKRMKKDDLKMVE
jgi:site-specific DNA-methyltransferase (adenine-specific)